MDDDFLDPSFLITKLVQCFCPNDLQALSRSFDVLKSFNFNQCEHNLSVFRLRWASSLEQKGKFDEFNILNNSIEIINKSIHRPNALFLLLDQLRPNYTQLTIDPERPFTNISLPTDFLFVLQGIEGSNFKWNSTQKRFVSSEKFNPNLYVCAHKISKIGCMVKTLLSFLDFKDSLIHQYAATVIREIYTNHLNYITSIESSFHFLTPNQLLTYLEGNPISELQAASIICNTLETMRAASIYNVLNHISKHGDKTMAQVATRMRDKSFEGIEHMIKSWVTKGAVDDPFSEFFIQLKANVPIYSNWWHDQYFIAKAIVPSDLTDELIHIIFSAGKALNFLRTCDRPVELQIDNKLTLPEYVKTAAKEANSLILGLIMKDDLLMNALHDINAYVLLQRGDFAKSFIETDPAIMKRMVSATISEFAEKTVENIRYDENEPPMGAFRYEAKSPLSAIFGPNELKAYKVVSGLLLRLKRCENTLNNTKLKLRAAQILAFEMQAFNRLVGDYFNVHIIHKSYDNFKNTVLEKEVSFDTLLAAHTAHVNFIARGCWATNSGRECRASLYKILDIIDKLNERFNGVKPDSKQNKLIDDLRKLFYESLTQFQISLQNHKMSGIELAPPLTRMFKNVFKI